MTQKKGIAIALAAALALGASGAALASPIDVGGVVFDPASPLNITMEALNLRETEVSATGDVLTGYGAIGSINGTSQATFCPKCDLNFTFSYTVQNIGIGASGNPQVVFTGGTINFFVDDTSGFNVLDPTSAGVGTPWLTLTGHTGMVSGFGGVKGTLFSNVNGTLTDPLLGSGGIGFLDAAGGPAAGYFKTHTQADGLGGFADFSFNSSFLTNIVKGCLAISSDPTNICHYPIAGTAELIGDSKQAVPEPGEMGLMGLGLGVLGLFFWRRRKEDESRA